MKRGRLVVFCGIDGSGKTTQADLLVEGLKKDGIKAQYVWCRWEPTILQPFVRIQKNKNIRKTGKLTDNIYEGMIKSKKQKYLNNLLFRWLWMISFFIDYGFQIFLKVRIKLLTKRLIISDRMFYDSIIDQAINLGDRKDWLLKSLDAFWLKIIFPQPDMVIYIDCPEELAFSRKKDYPNIDCLVDRRKLYQQLADKYKWRKIDGTLSVDLTAVRIKEMVDKEMNLNK